MGFFDSMQVSATGMTAQRLRLDTISQNIANVNTTQGEDGTPYRRKTVVFEEINKKSAFQGMLNKYIDDYQASGVKVSRIVEDPSDFRQVYNPNHPDANDDGYVQLPNVNVVEEMTNMISANRSYEANVTAFNATKAMASKALEIGK